MFKATKFKVTFKDHDGLFKTEEVRRLDFNSMGAAGVTTVTGKVMAVDYIRVYLREFTTKFDKLGQEIYFGDVVKMAHNGVELHWTIGIADGIPSIISDQVQQSFPLTENNVTKCERVGDMHADENLILTPLTPEMLAQMQQASERVTETEL